MMEKEARSKAGEFSWSTISLTICKPAMREKGALLKRVQHWNKLGRTGQGVSGYFEFFNVPIVAKREDLEFETRVCWSSVL
jgi:hypothetical protein